MAWFRYLKETTSTSFSYPYTKRLLTQFTPNDDVQIGSWLAVSIAGLDINKYIDENLLEQIDETSYIVVYEDEVGDNPLNSIPCSTVISGDILYFQTPVEHIRDTKIDRVYSLYYNTPNLRYIAPFQNDYVIDVNNPSYAASINDVDATSFEVTLQSTSYNNFTFINAAEDWVNGSSSKPGAKVFISFTGPNIDLFGNRGPDGGKVRVRVSSYANTATPYTTVPVDWTVVDFYSREVEENTLVYRLTGLPESVASMEIEVIPEKNPLSSGNKVIISSYQFSPSFDIQLSKEFIYGAIPFSTVNPYGSGSQFFAGSGVFGETLGPTGPTGPQGEEGRLIASDTAPLNPLDGQQWLDITTGRQFAAYNGVWFEVGAAFQGQPGPSGFGYKNYIINGCMRIWQRGAGPWTTNTSYTADRWVVQNSVSTFSASRQSFTPGEIPSNEHPYFLRTQVLSAGPGTADNVTLVQRIEGVRSLAGQTISFSFWAKADGIKKIGVEFLQNFGIGGSASVSAIGSQAFTVNTTWTRYTGTVVVPSIAGKTIGTDDRFTIIFWFDAGSALDARSGAIGHQTGIFDLWGVQVESGTSASAFDPRPISAELALCQRYYYRITSAGGYNPFAMGWCYTTSWAIGMVNFPVTMRKTPISVEVTSTPSDYALWGDGVSIEVCTSVPTISIAGPNGAMVTFFSSANLATNNPTGFYANNNAVAYLGFSAEY